MLILTWSGWTYGRVNFLSCNASDIGAFSRCTSDAEICGNSKRLDSVCSFDKRYKWRLHELLICWQATQADETFSAPVKSLNTNNNKHQRLQGKSHSLFKRITDIPALLTPDGQYDKSSNAPLSICPQMYSFSQYTRTASQEMKQNSYQQVSTCDECIMMWRKISVFTVTYSTP